MDNKKHNGWANIDTWRVVLWLENDYSNYQFIRKYKTKLLKMKKSTLIQRLKMNCKFGDKINWSNVHITEVKQAIRDMV